MFSEAIVRMSESTTSAVETINQTTTTAMDWNEIIYIFVGAIIGLVASAAMLIIERIFNNKGKIYIYYTRTNQRGKNGHGWGFDKSGDGRLYLTLPIIFEIQNTSNTTRVIRDVSLLLYNEKMLVGKMHQISGVHITERTGNKITGEKDYNYGSEKGSYSFVLPPCSIQRQVCEYIFAIPSSEKIAYSFNTVVARYYDEKNKIHAFKMMDIDNPWEIKHYEMDEEWIMLNEKIILKNDMN